MGIIGFMRGLANDVADDGITSNAALPHDDMQIITPTTSIERWLESVDHLIEKHRADTAIRDHGH
jgi:hypothetical protein